jgi:hypothetical protein
MQPPKNKTQIRIMQKDATHEFQAVNRVREEHKHELKV